MRTSRWIILASVAWALSSAPGAQQREYPAPRYPELRALKSAQDLLPIARAVVKKPSRRSLFNVGYEIQQGEKALLVVDSRFDRRVLEAIVLAIREAGAKPDVFITDARPPGPADGAEEAQNLLEPRQGADGGRYALLMNMAEMGKYNILIHGSGGPRPATSYRWEYIPWNTIDKFVTGVPDYPSELLEAIDQKAWETLLKAKKVRVTDPEGTDIRWTVRGEDFKKAAQIRGIDVVQRGHVSAWPLFTFTDKPDAEGVIAGTTNHVGVFPYIKVHVQGQRAVRIEGGGRYGELWQALLQKYKDVQWPGHPGRGMGWLLEVAIGTHPKVIRPVEAVEYGHGITWERSRSGVIHWGIGVLNEPGGGEEVGAFSRGRGLPQGHLHVHTYFSTVEVETADGQKLKLIDRGRLPALDDPEIRRVAARYGDPDELLKEAWIPAIPGINVPGDYIQDYASDSGTWIRKEHGKAYGDFVESMKAK